MELRDEIPTDIGSLLDDFNPKSIANKISGNLRERRLNLNLTQQALAGRSGVSLSTLKHFENKAEISLTNLLRIAVAIDATEEFYQLFSVRQYGSIDEILSAKKAIKRRRGRKNV
ncbi:MAG: helix-turn-helix transcriptional regulator [Bacteroidota bacterium]